MIVWNRRYLEGASGVFAGVVLKQCHVLVVWETTKSRFLQEAGPAFLFYIHLIWTKPTM